MPSFFEGLCVVRPNGRVRILFSLHAMPRVGSSARHGSVLDPVGYRTSKVTTTGR
jgi:hypothetical protein